jgi:hypothetical protein
VTYNDSSEKVINQYLWAVTRQPFIYDKKNYTPWGGINVSPAVFNSDWCPPACGGCCFRSWSLDWLPSDPRPSGEPWDTSIVEREVLFAPIDPVTFETTRIDFPVIYTDQQKERFKAGQSCGALLPTGYCSIHMKHPVSCDVPLLEFQIPQKSAREYPWLLHKKFGRAWALPKIDGTRGGLCQIEKAVDLESARKGGKATLRRLRRIKDWADHFGLTHTWLPDMIDWVEKGMENPPTKMLWLREPNKQLFGKQEDDNESGSSLQRGAGLNDHTGGGG